MPLKLSKKEIIKWEDLHVSKLIVVVSGETPGTPDINQL